MVAIGLMLAQSGHLKSHGLADLALALHEACCDTEDQGHEHGRADEGGDLEHHGPDHSHDKLSTLIGAARLPVMSVEPLHPASRRWLQLITASRLERPPRA